MVKCPQCGYECPPDFDFCPRCATPVHVTCPQCGFRAPPDFAFCPMCATALAPVAEETGPPAPLPSRVDGLDEAIQRLVPREFAERLLATRGQVQRERRMVTILKSDVKGSSAMARGMDPEDVMEIMDSAFEVLIEPIIRYEGTVARLEGDAIMAFFGAPIAHEDDPERACRAGLEIVQGARACAERLQKEQGIEGFNVRVGIHTGVVVVGEVGSDLRVEYTAMGEAPNLTARLESAAEPGTVLISEEMHRLIAPLFETRALEPIQAKGWEEPVPVFRVLAAKAVRGKARSIAGLESPLVGREAEFAALQEALERLWAGVGGIVTIIGEAGIGKSRLVAELRKQDLAKVDANRQDRAPSQGSARPRWVEGRCLSYATSIPYLLWLDVLRGLLGATLEDAPEAAPDGMSHALRQRLQALCPERFDDVYPHLARLMSLPLEEGLVSRLDDMDGQDLKTRTFRAVETLINCAASERPLVLVCEDLHWADSISIELLEQVLALSDRVPLLVVCVFRPETEHASWRIRETVARSYRHRHTDVWLDPLSAAESETLVGNLLHLEALPQGLRVRILEQAEGNPFYVEEIIRSLIDQGAIVHDEATGRWEATRDVAQIPIPDTLHGVLMARIDRLQEEEKRVLQMASVIGRVFLYWVLAEIAEEERELSDRLLTLQREELIRERARLPELEYIFKHELTREAAYNGLLKRERRAFHRKVAQALERLLPERVEEQVGLLAHHWERAHEPEKAIDYLLRAGDRARVLYAHEEAIDFYERALAFLRQGADEDRAARTLMKLGLTYHTAFEYRRSREAYDEGFALLQRAAREAPAAALPSAPHALRLVQRGSFDLDPGVHWWGFDIMESELFRGLVELGPQLEVLPGLARGWEVLEGGRRYVFHLQKEAKWSDGAPVTAYDVEFAWKRVLDPATGAPFANLLYDVKGGEALHRGEASDPDTVGVRALDDTTLLVDLENATGYFLQLLSHEVTFPVPRHVVEAHGKAWVEPGTIATNGPFALAEYRPGESVALIRNHHYRGAWTGNVERVHIALLEAEAWTEQVALYEAEELDTLDVSGFPVAERDRLRQRYPDQFVSASHLTTGGFAFNVTRQPLNDVRVRQALTMALDREVLAGMSYRGYALPATGGFVPPGMPGHSPGIGLPYDPERARCLLAETGFPVGRGFPALRGILPSGSGSAMAFADYLEAQWRRELGVEVEWVYVPLSEYTERVGQEQPHLRLAAWYADYPDPDNFLRVGFGHEATAWHNEAYDRLVEEARRLLDQGERMALYRQADRILVEAAPFLPGVYMQSQVLIKPWVRRYSISVMGRWSPWKDVIIEPH